MPFYQRKLSVRKNDRVQDSASRNFVASTPMPHVHSTLPELQHDASSISECPQTSISSLPQKFSTNSLYVNDFMLRTRYYQAKFLYEQFENDFNLESQQEANELRDMYSKIRTSFKELEELTKMEKKCELEDKILQQLVTQREAMDNVDCTKLKKNATLMSTVCDLLETSLNSLPVTNEDDFKDLSLNETKTLVADFKETLTAISKKTSEQASDVLQIKKSLTCEDMILEICSSVMTKAKIEVMEEGASVLMQIVCNSNIPEVMWNDCPSKL